MISVARSATTSTRSRRLATTAITGTGMLLATGAAGIGAPEEINPQSSPIVVSAQLAEPTTVTLEVRNAAGAVVALTEPGVLGPGPGSINWDGRRGPTATGAPVADGVYRMQLRTEDGSTLPAEPERVRVDTRAPRVTARVQPPRRMTLPPSAPGLRTEVRDTSPTTQTRVIATPVRGAALSTRWSASTKAPRLPAAISSGRRSGVFSLVVEARDGAGNTAQSEPVTMRIAPPAGRARTVRRGPAGKPWMSLTFDDGLYGSAMSSIIATLRREDMGATFCLNGVNSGRWSSSLRAKIARATSDGVIDLCSHGYSHRTNRGTGLAAARRDLARNVVVDRAFGVSTAPLYRPPSGLLSPGLVTAAGELGYRNILMWDIDPSDYIASSSGAITSHVVRRARRGSIVVLHAQPITAAALPDILRGLRAKGLRSVPASRLLRS